MVTDTAIDAVARVVAEEQSERGPILESAVLQHATDAIPHGVRRQAHRSGDVFVAQTMSDEVKNS